jgi:hypothetical protein
MPMGRPAKLNPRLAVNLPLHLKAGILEAASLCRTNPASVMTMVLEKLSDPKGEDLPDQQKVEVLGRQLADMYLSRLEDEKRLAVRGQEEVVTVS